MVRNLIGILIEFTERKAPATGNHRCFVRIKRSLPLKQYICRGLLHRMVRLIIAVQLTARPLAYHADFL